MPDRPGEDLARTTVGHAEPDSRSIHGLNSPAGEPTKIQEALGSMLALSVQPIALEELVIQCLRRVLDIPGTALGPGARLYTADDPSSDLLDLMISEDSEQEVRPSRLRASPNQCFCGAAVSGVWPARSRCEAAIRPADVPARSRARCCVPLWCRGQRIGILEFDLRSDRPASDEEVRLLVSVAAVLAAAIDRSRVEESLRRSEERFDLAIRGTDAGIWDWDLLTNAVYFSPRWKSQLGYAEDEIAHNFDEWEKRLHPDDRERALATVRAYLDGRTTEFELEHRLRHKDGSYRWILARGASVRDSRGRASRMVGSHIDITERKKAEARQLAQEARLLAARDILERLMPRAPLRQRGIEIDGASFAADYAQGDCFDYFTHPDGSIYVLVADASGHGIDSALLMASLHARLRAYAEMGLGLAPLLDRTNTVLTEQTGSDRFATLLILRIDPVAGSLRYVNAGHPPGWILDSRGRVRYELTGTGIPLAITADAGYPVSRSILLEPGDQILMITDGLLEAISPGGQAFGANGVLETVRASLNRPGPEILARLHDAVCAFTGTTDLQDDVTGVVARFLPS